VTSPIAAWLSAFLFTQAVEVPLYVSWMRREEGPLRARPLWAQALLAWGASAITHPFVWFVFPELPHAEHWQMVLPAEIFAVTVEAIYFHALGLRRTLAWSLVANGASLGIGLVCRSIFGWP
jgi:hypothetical protein